MSSVSIVVAVVVAVSLLCPANAYFRLPFMGNNIRQTIPRCPALTKPCRILAVMEGDGLVPETISNEPCSCPDSKTCSNDWRANSDRVIMRELVTNGNMQMTLYMMFCDPVQPQRQCAGGEVALNLTGHSHLPTEVEAIHCTCADTSRPLVLHRTEVGSDHRNYHSYVCADQKDECRTRGYARRNRDECLTTNMATHTVTYPCRCPAGMACTRNPGRSSYSTATYTCSRPSRRN